MKVREFLRFSRQLAAGTEFADLIVNRPSGNNCQNDRGNRRNRNAEQYKPRHDQKFFGRIVFAYKIHQTTPF